MTIDPGTPTMVPGSCPTRTVSGAACPPRKSVPGSVDDDSDDDTGPCVSNTGDDGPTPTLLGPPVTIAGIPRGPVDPGVPETCVVVVFVLVTVVEVTVVL